MAQKRVEIHVAGRVQGVGYRAFVVKTASELGLRGWTKNLSNGSVQTLAEGVEADLEVFLARLLEGPRYAEVMRHTAEYSDATGEFQGFTVRY